MSEERIVCVLKTASKWSLAIWRSSGINFWLESVDSAKKFTLPSHIDYAINATVEVISFQTVTKFSIFCWRFNLRLSYLVFGKSHCVLPKTMSSFIVAVYIIDSTLTVQSVLNVWRNAFAVFYKLANKWVRAYDSFICKSRNFCPLVAHLRVCCVKRQRFKNQRVKFVIGQGHTYRLWRWTNALYITAVMWHFWIGPSVLFFRSHTFQFFITRCRDFMKESATRVTETDARCKGAYWSINGLELNMLLSHPYTSRNFYLWSSSRLHFIRAFVFVSANLSTA